MEFDEWGGIVTIPVAVLAAALLWRSRTRLWASTATWQGPATMDRAARWLDQAGSAVLGWLSGFSSGGTSGNARFDAYYDDARRRLDAERAAFRAFRRQAGRAQDQAEFDAFLAGRNGTGSSPTDRPA